MKIKPCIIILSHHSYCDIWEMTMASYQKYIDWEIDRFITSDGPISSEIQQMVQRYGFKLLIYPDNVSWSSALKYIMEKNVEGHYDSVLFSFDDLVLTRKVDSAALEKCFKITDRCGYLAVDAGHRNLFSDLSSANTQSKYFKISKEDSYVGSLVFSIWNVNFFSKVINDPGLNELNPWQYEVAIPKVLEKYHNIGFFATKKAIIYFSNIIVKGRILQSELRRAEAALSMKYRGRRPYMPTGEKLKFEVYRRIFKSLRYLLPHSIFRRLRKSY